MSLSIVAVAIVGVTAIVVSMSIPFCDSVVVSVVCSVGMVVVADIR